MSEPKASGTRFTPMPDPPDAAELVARGLAVGGQHAVQSVIKLAVSIERARELISPTIAVLETRAGVDGTIARIGGDADWIARYLASLDCEFEVLEGDEVENELRALAIKILGGLPPSLDPSWPGSAAPGGSPPSHE
jgi:hypothetical protein